MTTRDHFLQTMTESINGMSKPERERLEEIGFDAWLDEYNPRSAKKELSGKRCALGAKAHESRET